MHPASVTAAGTVNWEHFDSALEETRAFVKQLETRRIADKLAGEEKAKHKPRKKWDPRSIFSRWMQPPDAADVSDESQSESSAREDAEVIQTPARGVGITRSDPAIQNAKAKSRQNFDGGQIAHQADTCRHRKEKRVKSDLN